MIMIIIIIIICNFEKVGIEKMNPPIGRARKVVVETVVETDMAIPPKYRAIEYIEPMYYLYHWFLFHSHHLP